MAVIRPSAPESVRPSQLRESVAFEPHEAPITLLADLVTKIVQAEGPIHRDLVARRVAEAFGKGRTGKRIREASDRALERAMLTGGVLPDGEFVMTPTQKEDPPVRDRSAEGAPTSATQLPPVEIRAAAARVVAESGEMERDELIVATARLLGFARVGSELRGVIDGAMSK